MLRFLTKVPSLKRIVLFQILLLLLLAIANLLPIILSFAQPWVSIFSTVTLLGNGINGSLQVLTGWPGLLAYVQHHSSHSGSASLGTQTSSQNMQATSSNIPSSATKQQKSSRRIRPILGIGVITLIGILLLSYIGVYPGYSASSCTPYSPLVFWSDFGDIFWPRAIYARMMENQCIGISDGGFKLFSANTSSKGLPDSYTMSQAVQAFRNRSYDTASQLWQQAIGEDRSDAEPYVYLQDLAVQRQNSQQYFDILIVTTLSANDEDINVGQNELRGFYTALNGYDNPSPSQGIPIRFLIANIGSNSIRANQVEQQIAQLTQDDTHLIGILGWPTSNGQAINAIQNLEQTKLPIISPSATADILTQWNRYFFRMVPPNEKQAEADIPLVEAAFQRSHSGAKQRPIRVAVLTTKDVNGIDNPYSISLARDFVALAQQTSDIQIVYQQAYTTYQKSQITKEVKAALARQSDVIYLPGYSEDTQTVLDELDSEGKAASQVVVVGGDGVAHVKNYPYSGYPQGANNRLYYTSFTVPPSHCSEQSGFYSDYYSLFGICPDNDAMLAYDAAQTMFWAIDQTINMHGSSNISSDDLWQALKDISVLHPLVGKTVTGSVAFQSGDRIDQLIKSFFVDGNGRIEELQSVT